VEANLVTWKQNGKNLAFEEENKRDLVFNIM
jgi:hypothetical protein